MVCGVCVVLGLPVVPAGCVVFNPSVIWGACVVSSPSVVCTSGAVCGTGGCVVV